MRLQYLRGMNPEPLGTSPVGSPHRITESRKGVQGDFERWKGTQSPLQAIGAPLRYGGLRASSMPPQRE